MIYQHHLMSNNRNHSDNDGFTLIELLIVIAIIGILASFLLVNFIGIRQHARDSQRKSDVGQIQTAVQLYYTDNGMYPPNSSIEDPSNCGKPFGSGNAVYLNHLPCDPLSGLGYDYDSPSDSGTGYSITACLENSNDFQADTTKDDSDGLHCTTVATYTRYNPN